VEVFGKFHASMHKILRISPLKQVDQYINS